MVDHIASRLEFMEMDEAQRQALRGTGPVVRAVIGRSLDRFYDRAARTPHTASFFSDKQHMSRAKAAQERHWSRITDASFDQGYYESVRRIGSTHARIGLEPRWYVGSYALVLEGLLEGIQARMPWWRRLLGIVRPAVLSDPSIAVVKAALLDMEVSLSIYFEEAQAAREVAVARLDTALEGLAKGDLTEELSGMPESFAAIERSYNEALGRMRDMIGTVGEGASRLRTGIGEIAHAADDLARRTQSNAASLEETTAALSQMDDRLKATADAAAKTVVRADQAISAVGTGRSVAEEAVHAMSRVSDSAKGIDDVIEGLDKIAFQTRVLAMNAAVEAGRAGEAGRGFAVVADLVSALAMRAEEEARRAREQLSATQNEVVVAVDAVQKVDGALAGIAEDVGQVHALLASMSNDNSAQSLAIGEISTSLGGMDRATQQNAAMVEQTSAAARTLSEEIVQLADQAGGFKVTRGADSSAKRATARKAKLPSPSILPAASSEAMQLSA